MLNPHTAKHNCNSHKPALQPKIAIELVCLPTLFLVNKIHCAHLRNRKFEPFQI